VSKHRLDVIPGQVPNPAHLPPGCPFHPRCGLTCDLAAKAHDEATIDISPPADAEVQPHRVMRRCTDDDPPLREVKPGHWAACWFTQGHEHGQATEPDVAYRRAVSAVS
jgi:hypothetical protein